jgi:hypothetical protein
MIAKWQEPGGTAPTPARRIHNVSTQDLIRALDEPYRVITHFVKDLNCSRPCFAEICPYCPTLPKAKTAYVAALLYKPGKPIPWEEIVWGVPELAVPHLGLGIRGVLFDARRINRRLIVRRDDRQITQEMPPLEAFNLSHVEAKMNEHWFKPSAHRPPDLLPWEPLPAATPGAAPAAPGQEQPTLLDFAATASEPVPEAKPFDQEEFRRRRAAMEARFTPPEGK